MIKGQSKSARGASKEVIVSLEASWASLVVPSQASYQVTPDLSVRWHRTLIENGVNQCSCTATAHRARQTSTRSRHQKPPTPPLGIQMLQVRSVGLIHALLESRKRLRRIPAGGLLQRLPSHKVSTCLAHQGRKKKTLADSKAANSFVPSSLLPPRV